MSRLSANRTSNTHRLAERRRRGVGAFFAKHFAPNVIWKRSRPNAPPHVHPRHRRIQLFVQLAPEVGLLQRHLHALVVPSDVLLPWQVPQALHVELHRGRNMVSWPAVGKDLQPPCPPEVVKRPTAGNALRTQEVIDPAGALRSEVRHAEEQERRGYSQRASAIHRNIADIAFSKVRRCCAVVGLVGQYITTNAKCPIPFLSTAPPTRPANIAGPTKMRRTYPSRNQRGANKSIMPALRLPPAANPKRSPRSRLALPPLSVLRTQ